MSSIFTKIIRGEVPSYKIYEDDKTYAFLDIHPESRGHVLVVPKVEVDRVYDLPDEDYEALMWAVKRLARRMEDVLKSRVLLKVIGTDVPHAHVHLVPLDVEWRPGRVLELDESEMREMMERLKVEGFAGNDA
jgi:histidine triad (HIT) family protein